MTAAVRAWNLSKAYRDAGKAVEVLQGVEFAAEAGEVLAIVGPSGCGKSTLLHLLGGLDTPDTGGVEIAGQAIHQMDPVKLAGFRNRTLGFVFQFHELLPDFSALENVALPGRIADLEPAGLIRRAEDLLGEVGLTERRDHFPSQLSGGERQRVALCRALLLEPPVLLADEPTGNLDPESGEQVFELFLELQRRHQTTTVLVTHNLSIAARCGRVLRLENGVLRSAKP